MLAIIALLVVIGVSVVINRVATSALVATGLSHELAYFQARSALTGVGYTTDEAEAVAGHPARRQIVLFLMLVSNAGLAGIIATLILGFGEGEALDVLSRFSVLFAGLVLLLVASSSERVDRWLRRVIERGLTRYTDFHVRDYTQLLHVAGDYSVQEIRVQEDDWIAGASLAERNLAAEGILVLGIRRGSGEFVGAPTGDDEVHVGDAAVLYGRDEAIADLAERRRGPEGDVGHQRRVDEQRDLHQEHLRGAGTGGDGGGDYGAAPDGDDRTGG